MLAAFVHPGLFFAGAAAAVAPIVIHLLARRRFRRIRWAAIEFLLGAERRNRRRILLEQIILLALRCLAVLLIGSAVARPFLRPEGWAAVLGGPGRTERVFLLDDSYSMGYAGPGGTCFEAAKANLVRLIDWVRRNGPGDTVTVLRSSDPASPLAVGLYLDDASAEELKTRIEALRPSQRVLDVEAALAAVRRLLDESPAVVNATLFVLGDFQRVDWLESDTGPHQAEPGPATPLAGFGGLLKWAQENRSLHGVFVAVGQSGAANRSLAGLKPAQPRFVAGLGGRVEAVVANHADSPAEKLELRVSVGLSPAHSVSVPRVDARQTTAVPLDVTLLRTGFEPVRVELPPDGLTVDNARTLAVHVDEAVRVLVVNGEPSGDAYHDEVHLLASALRPGGPVFSGNTVRVVDEAELEGVDLSQHEVVILANLYRLSDPAVERLESYVRSGGGLAVFLGDQVDPEHYNDWLHADGRGLLPARLIEAVQAPPAGVPLAEGDYLHPVVRVFGGRDNPFVEGLRFHRYYLLDPAGPDAGPATDAPAGEAATALVAPAIVARFGDAARSPAIIERRFGGGRVLLLASSCDLEWNGWARDPSYVVTLLEIVRHLARPSRGSAELLVGTPIEIPVDPARYEPRAVLRTPGYPAEEEIGLTAVSPEDGRGLLLRFERTNAAGLYTILLRTREGTEETRLIAINLDPREGDLTIADEEELRSALSGLSFDYLTSAAALDELDQGGRRELWPFFLVAAVTALVAEQALAFWFGRRA